MASPACSPSRSPDEPTCAGSPVPAVSRPATIPRLGAGADLAWLFCSAEADCGFSSIHGAIAAQAQQSRAKGTKGVGGGDPDRKMVRIVGPSAGGGELPATRLRRVSGALRAADAPAPALGLEALPSAVLSAVYGPHDWRAQAKRAFGPEKAERLLDVFEDFMGPALVVRRGLKGEDLVTLVLEAGNNAADFHARRERAAAEVTAIRREAESLFWTSLDLYASAADAARAARKAPLPSASQALQSFLPEWA
jgi:hypothetical protein